MLTFQEIISNLESYWEEKGCTKIQSFDMEMGAATFHPATVLKAVGKKPWSTVFVQPCRRPSDGRYGQNPNRLQHYYQLQVLIKPNPLNSQELYLESLSTIGIDKKLNDIKFIEDDWESPTLGATGLGWEVQCNGMEISQFTYFQQIGGLECKPVSLEITYGLERITTFVQNIESVYDIKFDKSGLTYRDIFFENEKQMSFYNFQYAPKDYLYESFRYFEKNSKILINEKLPIPAYEQCIKASHAFNLLDSRGLVSVSERQAYILRIRSLVQECCKLVINENE